MMAEKWKALFSADEASQYPGCEMKEDENGIRYVRLPDTKEIAPELKPCPFCGEANLERVVYMRPFAVQWRCMDCRIPVPFEPASSNEAATEAWNTRPAERAAAERIAELEAAQRWIPVTEKLPEVGDQEISDCVEIYSRRFGVLVAWFEQYKATWVTNLGNYQLPHSEGDITHWRLKSAPPPTK